MQFKMGKDVLYQKQEAQLPQIAQNADDVHFSVDDVHSALTLAFNSFNAHLSQTDSTDEP